MRAVILSALFLSQFSMASGWLCSGSGYHAKLINKTSSPRTPAVFVVSNRQGTMLTAKGKQIHKRNLSNGVRYTATDDGLTAILFVQHREGADDALEHGEEADGKLILNNDREGDRDKADMNCKRYLKKD
jgi:hypothetical protein